MQGGMVKSGRLEQETIFYGHYRSIFNHCDVTGGKTIEFGGEKNVHFALMT